jgi:hypothetical protein
MRFDGYSYVDCKWCDGRGCIYCESEADAAYKRAFPEGVKPIASFPNTPDGLAAARAVIGKEALEKAFGPNGGGLAEFMHNMENAIKAAKG